jgi:hypothetical protein
LRYLPFPHPATDAKFAAKHALKDFNRIAADIPNEITFSHIFSK